MKNKNPVTVRRLPGGGYRVTVNRKVTAYRTTRKKAQAQAALLRGVRHGMKIRKNPKGQRKNPVTVHSPKMPVMIYGRLLRIEAQKGPRHICDAKCKAAGHKYYHDFSRHAKVYGMPDGSLKIVDKT
jgi:hypothetical protein